MHETMVSRTAVVTCLLWTATTAAWLAGWAVTLLDKSHEQVIGPMLVGTAIILAAMAACAQCVVVGHRICALIRASHEVTREAPRVRSLH